MINLVMWLFFGLFVGVVSKKLHPGDEKMNGWVPTLFIGVVGSYAGGLLSYALGNTHRYHPAGLIFSVLGGILFLFVWNKINARPKNRRKTKRKV
jgi:uncharacterized membrane protein YeaQ/YmgE (transglycosylase-associated protein family)